VGSSSKRRGSKASKSGRNDCKSDKEGSSLTDSNALLENEDNLAIDDDINLKQAFMDTHVMYLLVNLIFLCFCRRAMLNDLHFLFVCREM